MNTRGFSLIETMVALSVFSVAAMGLLSLNTQTVRFSSDLDKRLLAKTVADNIAVDTVTGKLEGVSPKTTGEEVQRGRTYVWTRTIEATPNQGLYSVRIRVSEADNETVLAQLSLLAIEGKSP
jgi:general secretion pathway protein I